MQQQIEAAGPGREAGECITLHNGETV